MEVLRRLSASEGDSVYLGKNLAELAIEARKLVNGMNKGHIPSTTVAQFISDLRVYGLREALAYVAADEDQRLTPEFEAFVVAGYEAIGRRFLRHIDKIKARFERQAQAMAGDMPTAIGDRLIVGEILSYDGPWKDGEQQISLAKLT
jgi:hypothetical protein